MKAELLTIFQIINYGSVLQTYATQKLLEQENIECEILNYITETKTFKSQVFNSKKCTKKKSIKNSIKVLMKSVSQLIRIWSFRSFKKNYLNISKKKYMVYDDILNDPPVADVYVVGSDQVWNSKYNNGIDRGYYLEFTDSKNKVAFSSGFGSDNISDSEKAIVHNYLSKFKAISVREDSALEILASLGLSAEVIIDPTLQLDKEQWRTIASKRLVKEKYVLLFIIYGEDNGATQIAREVADRNGYKLVKLCWEFRKNTEIDKMFTHRSPEDFLALFLDASFIVTNSFHGTAFSINFNKQFIFVEREEFNARIDSLLRLTDLLDRKVKINSIDSSPSERIIDYKDVNTILDTERQKGKDFIKRCISG